MACSGSVAKLAHAHEALLRGEQRSQSRKRRWATALRAALSSAKPSQKASEGNTAGHSKRGRCAVRFTSGCGRRSRASSAWRPNAHRCMAPCAAERVCRLAKFDHKTAVKNFFLHPVPCDTASGSSDLHRPRRQSKLLLFTSFSSGMRHEAFCRPTRLRSHLGSATRQPDFHRKRAEAEN